MKKNNTETKDIENAIIKSPKKTCGSKSASLEINNTATNEEISQIVKNAMYWYKREIVKTDEECADRLNEFFEHIMQTGEIPTVEKMCLALGTVRVTVWEWEQGKRGPIRANMIKKAKEILAALDAELVSMGKIPQVTYIFRAKNFFGMKDQQEHIITPNTGLEAESVDNLTQAAEMLPDGE